MPRPFRLTIPLLAAALLALFAAAPAPAQAAPGADHAARRLHHRLARLLAGAAVGPAAAHRLHQHRLRRHAARPRLQPGRYDGDNEGHGGFLATDIANQNQLPGWLVRHPPRHRAHAPRHQRRLEQPSHRADPRRVRHAGGPDAGQQPGHEDPGGADHPDDPERLHRCPPRRGRAQQRHPRLGREQEHRRSRRSPWSTSSPASTRRGHRRRRTPE